MKLMKYADVETALPSGRSHLLLGNGFSISCKPVFSYGSLFEYAKKNGLPKSAVGIFERLGTNNFEGVMRLLDDGEWLAKHYGLLPKSKKGVMSNDLESVKNALVAAIAKTHPKHTNKIEEDRKARCVRFLAPYHNIFTTNYDLLLYWVEMSDRNTLKGRDGFRQDIDGQDDDYVVFSEHLGNQEGMFFIHGALHLYVVDGQVRKHSWARTGRQLVESIKDGLDAGQYPLFVAEGKAERKLEQIERSGYLSYCLGKLGRIKNALVVLGLSFGASDEHISDVIARNKELKELYVGIHDGAPSSEILTIQRNVKRIQERREALIASKRVRHKLKVSFYSTASAAVWDEP